jgi:hypothetical protein
MESAEKKTEKDYWEQQAETPLLRRGRGWWVEVGFSNIVLTVAAIAVVVLLVLDLT